MIRSWISRIVAVLVILSLSACSLLEKWHDKQHRLDRADPFERRIYVNGKLVPGTGEDILFLKKNDPEEFNRIIDDLIGVDESINLIDNRDEKLKQFVRLFDSNRRSEFNSDIGEFNQEIKDRVSGSGGFIVRLFLYYFLVCDEDELRSLGSLKVIGKIDKWVYDQKATLHSKEKMGDRGSGYIFWQVEAKDCKGVKHDYKFHIAVDEGYELWANLAEDFDLFFDYEDIDNMIPKDEIERNIEEERRFDYKLHAKGSSIHVLTVFLDNELVDDSDPIYRRDETSCIDLFFEGDIGATELPDQSDYCMGRCDKPPIINTGAGD